MGALSPVLTGLTAMRSVINAADRTIGSVRGFGRNPYEEQSRILREQQDLALKQLQDQQDAQARDLAERTALERERMATTMQAAETERRAALRRAVARQRASFGAQGLAPGDGSPQAVLLGLFDESDEDRATRERLDDIRSRVLDQEAGSQSRINFLQRTQLAERQSLARLNDSNY